jgi:DNA polymerase III subunit beta
MKFSLPQSDFQQLLQTVVSAVPTKSTLPILSNVLIEAADGRLTLVATDLDISIRTSGKATVSTAGSITLPAKKLADIVRELPNDEIRCSVSGTRVKIECKNGTFSIVGLEAEEYPQLPVADTDQKIAVPTEILEKGVRRTSYAVSTDETRQMLTGVLLQIGAGRLNMVATDGHRLARAQFKGDYNAIEKDMIVPPKALHQVVRLASGTVSVGLMVSKNYAIFDLGTTTVFSRLIDGSFPNYEQVIPKSNPKRVSVNREELIAAIRRVAVLADSVTHQIKLSLRPERLELSVNTADVGEGTEQVPVSFVGDRLDIGYNAAYLLDILRSIDNATISIHLNTPITAGIIQPEGLPDAEDLLCLVMPLRLPD